MMLLTSPALAQPSCSPARDGVVACMGEKLCRCRWDPGGTLAGRPAGYRWDCGALRPGCGVVPDAPALPPVLVLPPGPRR
jgi:hypothetical protein